MARSVADLVCIECDICDHNAHTRSYNRFMNTRHVVEQVQGDNVSNDLGSRSIQNAYVGYLSITWTSQSRHRAS